MKQKQRGLSLSGLLVWAVAIVIIAMLGMKVVPEYMEHRTILSAVKKVAASANASANVAQIRAAFDRQANVDYISSVTGADLDITKEGSQIVISFSYEKKVRLFANASLLLDFSGSSKD